MRSYVSRSVGLLAVAVAVATVISCAEQNGESASAVAIDADDIGGVVTSVQGPEAGVWVIAETTDLPTRFIRTVVTDDQGQYVLPDLPDASYEVFVRGYGLVDSARVQAMPGQTLDLDAVVAPDAAAAAEVYPAAWWFALADLPDGELSQRDLANGIRGCLNCHQLGNKATREIPDSILSRADSSLVAWDERTRMGPAGAGMGAGFQRLGAQRELFADWTDRIASGEVPTEAPPRPRGLERNLVITLWDWGTEVDGRTDSASSDLRDPTVNANGPVYAAVASGDVLAALDPVEHRAFEVEIPSTAPTTGTNTPPSPYWGDENIWERQVGPRSVGLDEHARVWFTGATRPVTEAPDFCQGEGGNAFGEYYPLPGGRAQVLVYDQTTDEIAPIDTCFSADHNQIGNNNFIYFGQNSAVGWIDTDTWDETQDAEASQGWCPAVVDTDGDGTITEWTEPDEAIDPAKDLRIEFGCYMPSVNRVDGSVWCSGIGAEDNSLMRLELGSNPPETCIAEVYEAPPSMSNPPIYGSGGVHIDSSGVAWQNWRGSGHLASFDRSKCDLTSGPATGQSCPEGWTFHRRDNPTFRNASFPINSDESYLIQVDHHDALGLGRDVPIYGAVNTDSLEAFLPDSEEFITLRLPYPMGFFSRSTVGRIDDASAGWKGKGLWSNYSNYVGWHLEGGAGVLQKAIKFQMRPDPLAK